MYLLDTQVLMWLDSNPQRIGKRTRQILRKAAKVVFSPISLAELRIKETKGQIALGDLFQQHLREFGLEEYGYLSRHSNEVTRFPWLDGHDPFDRLLLSQASADNLILITSDAKLLGLALPWILDAEK